MIKRYDFPIVGGEVVATIGPLVETADGDYVTHDNFARLERAVLEYDAAIRSCANNPDRMSSYCTTQGDDLDDLYAKMIIATGQPDPRE